MDPKETVCCPAQCGSCGGGHCHGRDGVAGSSGCCSSAAMDVGFCSDNTVPPCNVRLSTHVRAFYAARERQQQEQQQEQAAVQAAAAAATEADAAAGAGGASPCPTAVCSYYLEGVHAVCHKTRHHCSHARSYC